MPKVALEQKAPDFELASFDGKKFKLSSQFGKRHTLLVFNRGFA